MPILFNRSEASKIKQRNLQQAKYFRIVSEVWIDEEKEGWSGERSKS
ncbi:MAG: hypothetical protein ACJZ64_01735 [Opitutales bacterium]